jgi:hypothetical protein
MVTCGQDLQTARIPPRDLAASPYPWQVAAVAVLESHVVESHELVFVDLLATVASKSGERHPWRREAAMQSRLQWITP